MRKYNPLPLLFAQETLTAEINPYKWPYVLFCKDSLLLSHFARTHEPVKMSPFSAETSSFDYSLTQSHISEERNPQLHRFENL